MAIAREGSSIEKAVMVHHSTNKMIDPSTDKMAVTVDPSTDKMAVLGRVSAPSSVYLRVGFSLKYAVGSGTPK